MVEFSKLCETVGESIIFLNNQSLETESGIWLRYFPNATVNGLGFEIKRRIGIY